MPEVYHVCYDNMSVGTATISQQGLYGKIEGIFKLDRSGMFRLFMSCGMMEYDLGICVKNADRYEICTKLPLKQIIKPISFNIRQNGEMGTPFYALEEGKPFAYIKKLPFSCLRTEKGVIGVTCSE